MVNAHHKTRLLSTSRRCEVGRSLVVLGVALSCFIAVSFAQSASSKAAHPISVEGTVKNSAGELVAGAIVRLEDRDRLLLAEAHTKADGTFLIAVSGAGSYVLRAQKSGFQPVVEESMTLAAGERKRVNLTLKPLSTNTAGMEFEDKPTFTIAGVTDWTAAGGHGSDTNLRTSEALTKETLALKSDATKQGTGRQAKDSERELRDALPSLEAAHQNRPDDSSIAYNLAVAYKANGNFTRAAELVRNLLAHENKAEFHAFLGDLYERMNDPLGAVSEYEQAARLDPSEQNYFDWGTELLLHRAIQPAVEVLGKGSGAHPRSARMLSAWGAALYANGAYDEAALRLCAASDLNPQDSTSYLFLGKMENAAPRPLPCVDQKMARFVKHQPENALANFQYAMSLWKRQEVSGNLASLQTVQTLLEKAVSIDPRFDEAYLQLGILFFSQGKFEEAVGDYKKAIELNSRLGEAHYRLGVAYKRLGKMTEAAQEFEIHEQIQKKDAALVDRQRRDVRQFVTVLRDQTEASPR